MLLIETPGEMSYVQVTVRAGPDYEATPAERECSHFIEHLVSMLLRSRAYPGANTCAEAEDAGIALHAYTTSDRTVYSASALSELLPVAIDMLLGALTDFVRCFGDIVADPRWAREQQAVLQETSGRADSPQTVTANAFHAYAYAGHPRAVPRIESGRNVMSLTPACVLDYYRRHYVSHNMLLTVASGEPFDAVRALLAPHAFARRDPMLPAPTRLLPDAFPRGLAVRACAQPGAQEARISVSWPMPGVVADTPVADALAAAGDLLSGGVSARLMRALRGELGGVYHVGVCPGTDMTHAGFSFLTAYTSAAPEQLAAVLRVLAREMYALARDGPTAREMDKMARNARASRAHRRQVRTPHAWVGPYASQAVIYGNVRRNIEHQYADMLALTASAVRVALVDVLHGNHGCLVLYAGDPAALAPHADTIERAAREVFEC